MGYHGPEITFRGRTMTSSDQTADLSTSQKTAAAFRQSMKSYGGKFVILCVLALFLNVLLIWSVSSLRDERSQTARKAAADVEAMAGGYQRVSGPYILLPFTIKGTDGKQIRRVAAFLPDNLTLDSDLVTELRSRSIFQIPVYRNTLKIKADFNPLDINEIGGKATKPLWNEAALVMDISNTRGITSRVIADFGTGKNAEFNSGLPGRNLSEIHASLKELALNKPSSIAIDMQINGASGFSFAALGKTTAIAIKSNWQHPSFSGSFLPEQREISDSGFTATWRSSALARSSKAIFVFEEDTASDTDSSTVNSFLSDNDTVKVGLYTPADLYQSVERALKYGLLFIGGMFIAVFGLEMATGSRMHTVQYLMFGLALVLFYVLLLSFAEHIGFSKAYLAAAAATTALVACYVGKALHSFLRGLALFVILAASYGLLYLLLRMEDYALLVGSVAIFVALAVLMFATLKTDWSALSSEPTTAT